jgi:RNA polymerase sigma-70 factor (ECF subfamily)
MTEQAEFLDLIEEQRPWLDPALYAWSGGDLPAFEDLRQDVLEALYLALPRFRGESSPKTFIWRIARNIAAGRVRKEARRRKREKTAFLLDTASVEKKEMDADPSSGMIRKQEEETARKALRFLKPDDRALLVLRSTRDLSFAEIAEILGISEGAARVRANRARARFAMNFKEIENGR